MAAYKGVLWRLEGQGVGRAQTTTNSRIKQEETLLKGSVMEKASKKIFLKKNLIFPIPKEETPCRESGLLAKIYTKSFAKAKLQNIVYTSW